MKKQLCVIALLLNRDIEQFEINYVDRLVSDINDSCSEINVQKMLGNSHDFLIKEINEIDPDYTIVIEIAAIGSKSEFNIFYHHNSKVGFELAKTINKITSGTCESAIEIKPGEQGTSIGYLLQNTNAPCVFVSNCTNNLKQNNYKDIPVASIITKGILDFSKILKPRRLFKYGLAFIRDNKILLCQPYVYDDYILPGGVKEGNETHTESLQREIFEELGTEAILDLNSVKHIGNFEDIAAGKKRTTVEIELYLGEVNGQIVASSEIKKLIWFSLNDDPNFLSAIIRNKIFPELEKAGLLK